MYDIPELEKKWKKYKRDKIKKPIIIGSTISILAVGSIYFGMKYMNSSKVTNGSTVANSSSVTTNTGTTSKVVNGTNVVNSSNTQNTISTNSNTKTPTSVVVNTQKVKNDKPAIIITKSNNNSNEQNVLINTKNSQNSINENGESIDLSQAIIIKPNVPDDEIRVIGFDNKDKKDIENKYGDILMPSNTTHDIEDREHIKELEDKFKDTQNPEDSLAIARYYYTKGNYKKAEDWAVNTNNIDGDLEDSWLIFAKSRAKQGNRVDAIKVLQSFYDETNSHKAKVLLNKLRHGKKIK